MILDASLNEKWFGVMMKLGKSDVHMACFRHERGWDDMKEDLKNECKYVCMAASQCLSNKVVQERLKNKHGLINKCTFALNSLTNFNFKVMSVCFDAAYMVKI